MSAQVTHSSHEGHSEHEEPWMSAIAIGVGLILLGVFILATSQGMHSFIHTTEGLDHAIYIGGMVACALLVIFGAIGILVGLVNTSFGGGYGDDDHGDDGHDEHAHHGSWSPIIMAFGVMLFLMGFIEWNHEGNFGILGAGLVITFAGIANWWREDFGNDGKSEPIAFGEPFGGIEIRKVGMWIFLMSEVMIFGSFFSSYLRLRTGWTTHWDVECDAFGHGTPCPDGYVVVASELINESFWTLLPGAINTFALILSSFTLVTALRHAKMPNWQRPTGKLTGRWMPDQRRAVRNNLVATLFLGSLFLVLKLIEWDHMMNGAHPFTIDTLAGSVFYVTTGAHGFHVFVGLLVLLFFSFKAQRGGWSPDNAQSIEYFGLYWHFVDLAWVAIFPAFYLY